MKNAQFLDGKSRIKYLKPVRLIVAIALLLVLVFPLMAADSDPVTKGDLKQVLQVLEKRFEQIEKRFEQIDKRFEDLKWFMGFLTSIAIAALSYIMYRIHRVEEHREERDTQKVIIALRELAQKDPKVEKALKIVGLM